MPFPIIAAAVVARAGAKAGSKAALEENQKTQDKAAEKAFKVPRLYNITVYQQSAIDILLRMSEYEAIKRIHRHIEDSNLNIDFYSLVLQKTYLFDFLDLHPRFFADVRGCIEAFHANVEQKASEQMLVAKRRAEQRRVEERRAQEQAAREESNQKLNALNLKLSQIQYCHSASEKLDLLQVSQDKKKNSIGHLCFGNDKLISQYVKILKSLVSEDLFVILKRSNESNVSIFSLCLAYKLDVVGLLVKCITERPNVFFSMLSHFELASQTLQTLVNTRGCKQKARAYFDDLPYNEENQRLLEACLDASTNVGKFCIKKADRHLFQGNENKTIALVQKKLEAFKKSECSGRETPIAIAHLLEVSPMQSTQSRGLFTDVKSGLTATRLIESEELSHRLRVCASAPPAPEEMMNASVTIAPYIAVRDIRAWAFVGLSIILSYALCTYLSQEDSAVFRP